MTCTVQRQRICEVSGYYVIDPDDEQGVAPFLVYYNMTDKGGVGVTVVKHDSEDEIYVHGSVFKGNPLHRYQFLSN